ncbi:MAG: HAD family hydrolase [Blastocatellia bacterium]
MSIRAISFDFWNTLFTESPGAFVFYQENRLRALEETLRLCGEFTNERVREACLLESEAHYRIWRNEHRTLSTAERVGVILTNLEAVLPDDVMAGLVNAYEEGILERPPVLIKGVRDTVEQLARNYRLGIISDVGFSPGRVLKQVLAQNNLLGFFDSLVFSDEAGRSKPHVEVFTRTAQSLAAAPVEIVHIGDLEFTDIVGAKLSGYHAIRFTGVTPINDAEVSMADYVTADFADVPRFVETLNR